MKKHIAFITLIIALLPLCGCIGNIVPKTTISGSLGGAPFSITSPKNSELAGLEITNTRSESNSVTSIKIQSLKAAMDPAVITTTGEAQAKIVTAAFDSGAAFAGKVGAAVATGMAKP